ncbi:hypothetical protein GP486_007316 [Trichoglossum hirsutum]|uniref:Uncharacterized protein n=1 Tax=Trichoglossum hirsutum TaxID=265104 RepID=A0A9P8IJJ8_9PEZI|nr:hypothetical protein GP486_007316 [Trichoglossum hirsutum]
MLVEALESIQVQSDICSGAATALIRDQHNVQFRMTQDIDLIVQPDKSHHIDVEPVSKKLLRDFSLQFEAVHCFGARVLLPASPAILVEVEMFDLDTWPDHQQYDLNNTRNARVQVPIGGRRTAVAAAREDHHATSAGRIQKEETDLKDVSSLVDFVEGRALVMESVEEIQALKALLEKRQELKESLDEAIECPAAFGN